MNRVLAAVSGGKDSVAMLYALAGIDGIELHVFFIDLGIPGYSEESLRVVKSHAEALGLPLHVERLARYGFTIRDAAVLREKRLLGRPVCSVCGTVKRYLLNRYAVEHGFDAVATGHTMDDILGFYLASLSSRDALPGIAKLAPYTPGSHRLAARIRPLYFLTDAEAAMYVEARGLEIVSSKCPYAPRREKGLRLTLKKMLMEVDREHPGYRLMLSSTLADHVSGVFSAAYPPEPMGLCSVCGYPSSTDPCSFCRLRTRITGLLKQLSAEPGPEAGEEAGGGTGSPTVPE